MSSPDWIKNFVDLLNGLNGSMIVRAEGKSEEQVYWEREELIGNIFRRENINLRPDQLKWMLDIRDGLDRERERLEIKAQNHNLPVIPVSREEIINYKPLRGAPYDVSPGKFSKALSFLLLMLTVLAGPLVIGGLLALCLADYGWLVYTPVCVLLVIFLYSPWSPMVIFGFLVAALVEVRAESWHSSRWH